MEMRAPRPARLSAAMWPPWASTMVFAIGRPRPAPPIRRERALSKTIVYGPPQGADENIQVGLDLDSRTPYARSFDKDKRFLAEPYFAAHHVSVKPGEQVVFMVRAFTSKCYCEWEILVEANIEGKHKVFTVRDGSRPFRTTAFADSYRTAYKFDFFKGQFVRLPPGSKVFDY